MNVKMVRISEKDLEMIREWRMRPDITKFMNTDPILTIDDQKKWYENSLKDDSKINWIIYYNEDPIGFLSVFDIDDLHKRCSWGYYIAKLEARSLKLAMYLEWNLYDYVFDTLHLNKISAETFSDNGQVVKIHNLCGAAIEGIFKEHIHKNGESHDITINAILADEWYEKRKTLNYETYQFE